MKKKELDEEMKGVGGEYLEGIREEIDLYAKIRQTMASLLDILGDMNALTLQQHKDAEFSDVIKALE